MASDPKATLLTYLDQARSSILWKLDDLGEYDLRRPMTPTGTSLLGLVKHLASVELEYLGDVFGRPSGEELPWFDDDAAPNADWFVAADESSAGIRELLERAGEVTAATANALALHTPARVPWWPEDRCDVTLHQILVHMVAEAQRHAGHADLLRELIDGEAGLRPGVSNLPEFDAADWTEFRSRVESAARAAAGL